MGRRWLVHQKRGPSGSRPSPSAPHSANPSPDKLQHLLRSQILLGHFDRSFLHNVKISNANFSLFNFKHVIQTIHAISSVVRDSILMYFYVYIAYLLFGKGLVPPQVVVYGVAIFAVVDYLVFAVSVARQIARVLGIRIFHVFKPKEHTKWSAFPINHISYCSIL